MRFSEVIGHNRIKDVLCRGVQTGRVGHAYIFEGPGGVGKLSTAKAFAQLLLCDERQAADSCGVCKSCTQCSSGNHPDVQIVTNQLYDKSKKSTDILVDTIRNMKRDVYIKPYASERKVYIIPKADTMNLYAQNSLLKVLEEPPEYCTIILLAENSNSFLPTILSRVQLLKFYPLSEVSVKEYLALNCTDAETEAIDLAAKMCQGSIGKARLLLENSEAARLRDELSECVFALLGGKRRSIYDLMLFLKTNKDEQEFLMNALQSLFCDLMYIKQAEAGEEITNSDKLAKLRRMSAEIPAKAPLRLLEILLRYRDYFSKNISYALSVQCLSLELWEAINDRGYRSKV